MLSLLLAGLIVPAFSADENGSATLAAVRGTVVATDGRAVANAHVVAYSDVGVDETTADSKGRYLFLSLLPGTYYIRAYAQTSSPNLHPCSENPIELSAGQIYDANYQIDPQCAYDPFPLLTATRQ